MDKYSESMDRYSAEIFMAINSKSLNFGLMGLNKNFHSRLIFSIFKIKS